MTNTRVWNAFEEKKAEILNKLRHYRSMVANYKACKEQYELLFPSGTREVTNMPTSKANVYEPEKWADIRIEQSHRMSKSLNEMREEYLQIDAMIIGLESDKRLVVTRRYVLGESMEVVSEKLFISLRNCWYIHDAAIRALTDKALKS